ncbi:MAG TPA: type II toxin-antitoxin system VapC family toxin [Pyrinomonadaceae bacterium]|nr:type II toxin-antitoxin system VapC family toxin [Pyrinomonadaceae bacterium]
MLLDSNIIIYSALPENEFLREFIRINSPFVSDVSRIEVLGFQKLAPHALDYFGAFFSSSTLIPISEEVVINAIGLRQRRKITLGDSLIAATAIVYDLGLITKNTRDFQWIDELKVIDPYK